MSRTIILAIFVVALAVCGQTLLKYGVLQVGGVSFSTGEVWAGIRKVLSVPYILIGLAIYAVAGVLWLDVLSRLDLTMAYPMAGMSYVFALFIGALLFGETVSYWRILGVVLICGGVIVISRS